MLDEVNMAKSEAVAVLHATLDFRRVIDVPGRRGVVSAGAGVCGGEVRGIYGAG